MGAILSFGQDPRWRRAMVDAVDPASRAAGARRRDRHRAGRVRAVRARRMRGRRRSTRASRCSAGARARLAARPRARRSGPLRPRARPSGSRSPTASSTRSHSPTCCATSMIRRRRCASSPACVKPGGRIGMVEFGVPSKPLLRALVARAHPGRAPAARPARLTGVVRGRAVPGAEHRAVPRRVARSAARLWRAAGIDDVRERRMSFGAGLVMWGVRVGHRSPDRPPGVLRAAARRLARPRHAAAPARTRPGI